ncbi:glucose and galactose transporter [Phlyctema vagabunda]|uniref:Glucose and galactose transporter n=1 Tax=Phlyctema vagabunda TaxID=108571 RepID=A0ABR4PX39_9HELO
MAQAVEQPRFKNGPPHRGDEEIVMSKLQDTADRRASDKNGTSAEVTVDAPAPITSRVALKLSSACFAFCVAGITDGSFGALVPYILDGYEIGTGSVAIIYASSFAGWVVAALTGGYVRAYTGAGGSLVLGAAIQLLAQMLRVWTPPFGLFCFTFFLVAIGQAYQDSQSNTFVSTVKSAHRWLGLIHASYSIGLLIAPFVTTSIAVSEPSRWPLAFCFPLGLGVANLILVTWAFRDEMAFSKPVATEDETTRRGDQVWRETKETLKKKVVWLLSMFYFFYLGATFTAGGWIVEYLVTIRNVKLSKAGYVPSAFYGGTVVGRLLLPEPTYRFGEKRMLLLYALLCCALELVFWRVDNLIANTIVVAGMGFFLGPNFATGISVATKLIPKEIHASALGFIFVVAQAGAAMFPALTGLIAVQAGVGTLQPVLVGLLAAMALSWLLVPKVDKKAE